MAVSTTLEFASLDDLSLDATNPRLGRANIEAKLSQAEILDVMREWTLDELAVSYIEGGGFWPQEALLVIEEAVGEEARLVVVEGNRRLAALLMLRDAYRTPDKVSTKWKLIAESGECPDGLFDAVPFLRIDDREDVDAFLGFRHVTGIKEWHPAEKAAYIARLIDDRELSYVDVMRKIGSNTPTVRQNYIAFGLMTQVTDSVEAVSPSDMENRFSVMYLSLRTTGVQEFLGIDIAAEPDAAKSPATVVANLEDYATWMFGTTERERLFTDSRLIDKFGQILESEEAVEYLRRNERPKFDVAYEIAGGDEPALADLLFSAADNVELSLTRVHLYKDSGRIGEAVSRLSRDVLQLLTIFPEIQAELGVGPG